MDRLDRVERMFEKLRQQEMLYSVAPKAKIKTKVQTVLPTVAYFPPSGLFETLVAGKNWWL